MIVRYKLGLSTFSAANNRHLGRHHRHNASFGANAVLQRFIYQCVMPVIPVRSNWYNRHCLQQPVTCTGVDLPNTTRISPASLLSILLQELYELTNIILRFAHRREIKIAYPHLCRINPIHPSPLLLFSQIFSDNTQMLARKTAAGR